MLLRDLKVVHGDPERPVILLLHGFYHSAQHMLAPLQRVSLRHVSVTLPYDLRQPAEVPLGLLPYPPHIRPSPLLPPEAGEGWLPTLQRHGYTVITYTQRGFSSNLLGQEHTAYTELRDIVIPYIQQQILTDSRANAPLVIIGHSRGGILGRLYLHEQQGRAHPVRGLITVHSPHTGSRIGLLRGEWRQRIITGLSSRLVERGVPQLRAALILTLTPLIYTLVNTAAREMTPEGAVTRLLSVDGPQSQVQYATFGGTNPQVVNLYLCHARVYPGLQREAHWQRLCSIFGDAETRTNRLEAALSIEPEMRWGEGDGLVSDVSAHLPWAQHISNPLNHVACLWDTGFHAQMLAVLEQWFPKLSPI